MAGLPVQNVNNSVHDDANWRQRVNLENHAAAGWGKKWGFLEKNRKHAEVGQHLTLAELDAVQSKIAPCRDFLEAHRIRKQNRRTIGNMIMEQEKPTSRPGSRQSTSAPPVLKMDAATANSLQPQYIQGVGACIATPGVDPSEKYRHPQTSQQVHGWNAHNGLEFFGVSQHGRKAHAYNAQHDQ
jgi:hypothetical protein